MKNSLTLFAALLLVHVLNAQILNPTESGDGSQRLRASREYQWDSDTLNWDNEDSVTFNTVTDAQGTKKETILYKNSPGTSNWSPFRITQEVYDAGNLLMSRLDSFPSSLSSSRLYLYTYNANNQEVNNLEHRNLGGVWTVIGRVQTSYTATNKINSLLAEDRISNSWVNSSRNTYSYNGLDQQTIVLNEVWENNAWQGFSRETRTYNLSGLEESFLRERFNTQTLAYFAEYKNQYLYNISNLLETGSRQTWDTATSSWKNYYKDHITYNAQNQQDTLFRELWNTTTNVWDKYYLSTNTYNGNGWWLSNLNQYWNSTSSTFENAQRWTATYNANGYATRNLYERYNLNLNTWQNYYDYHYWYEADPLFNDISSPVEGVANFTVYPNPVIGPVLFVNAQSNLPYQIFDISGRLITTGQLYEGANNITLDVTSGIYLLKAGNSTTKIVKQ